MNSRNVYFKLRCTPAEQEEIHRRARDAGFADSSAWVRSLVLRPTEAQIADALGLLDQTTLDEPARPAVVEEREADPVEQQRRYEERVAELVEQGLPAQAAARVAGLELGAAPVAA